MSHTQFTRDTRVTLAALLWSGKSNIECAEKIGVHRSSIWREIQLNKDADGVYRGASAHKRATKRRKEAKLPFRKIENDKKLRRHIVRKLKLFWSPEQIAGRLAWKNGKSDICHETIYVFIYEKRPELIKYLRRQKNKYRRKRGTKEKKTLNRAVKIKRIDTRPEEVETRLRVGDWEGDTVIGKEKVIRLLTHTERKSGYGMAEKVDCVTAEKIHQRTIAAFRKIPKKVRLTLTRDNGVEFGDYDPYLEEKTKMDVYRAFPYHSWERGTNENWNGLIRQFFPKGTLFATITEYQVKKAVRLLNDRPRKRLGYKTPREVFKEGCNSK